MTQHRSLTIRLPNELYFEVAKLAQAENQPLCKKFNELIAYGLGRHIELETALKRLLGQMIEEEKA